MPIDFVLAVVGKITGIGRRCRMPFTKGQIHIAQRRGEGRIFENHIAVRGFDHKGKFATFDIGTFIPGVIKNSLVMNKAGF